LLEIFEKERQIWPGDLGNTSKETEPLELGTKIMNACVAYLLLLKLGYSLSKSFEKLGSRLHADYASLPSGRKALQSTSFESLHI
jgi:hypothetical protein